VGGAGAAASLRRAAAKVRPAGVAEPAAAWMSVEQQRACEAAAKLGPPEQHDGILRATACFRWNVLAEVAMGLARSKTTSDK
jgi:hypothetical protein